MSFAKKQNQEMDHALTKIDPAIHRAVTSLDGMNPLMSQDYSFENE